MNTIATIYEKERANDEAWERFEKLRDAAAAHQSRERERDIFMTVLRDRLNQEAAVVPVGDVSR